MSETSQNKKIGAPEEDPCLGLGGLVDALTGKCKKRDRTASEERLIQAGLEVFSKYGFDGATTKMIAKKAEVNESLIGRYFDGKEGLLMHITQRFISEMVHRELSYEPKEKLADELEAYVLDRIRNGCQHEDFAKIIIGHSLTDRKFKKKAMETIPMQLDPRLIQRVQELANKGKLKPGTNVQDLCHDLDTYMDGVFFFERILHETPLDKLMDQTVRFVRTFSKLFSAS